MFWIALVFAVIALACAVTGGYFYHQYSRSPAKAWRDRVLRLMAKARAQVRAERSSVERLGVKHTREEQALADQAFASFIGTVPVTELENYPGIGRATISKLRDAGFSDLSRLRHARIRVPGLGEKRLADIDSAVRDQLKQATQRFSSGACPEALSLAARVDRLRVSYQESTCRAQARATAAESIIERTHTLADVAGQVTFWRFFWKDSYELVTPQMMHMRLPDLQTALDAAARSPAVAHTVRGQSTRARGPHTGLEAAWRGRPDPGQAPPDGGDTPASSGPRDGLTKAPTRGAALAAGDRPGGLAPPAVPLEPLEMEKRPDLHLVIMELTLAFAFAVARADGPVTAKEREVIEGQMVARYKHDPALLNRAKALCAHYEAAPIDLDTCVKQVGKLFAPAHRGALLNSVALTIAQASGGISQHAADFLAKLARRLDVPLAAPKPAAPQQQQRPLETASVRHARPNTLSTAQHAAAVKPPAGVQTTSARPRSQPHPSNDEPQEARHPEREPAALPTRESHLAALEIEPSTRLSAGLIRRQFNMLSARFATEKFEAMGQEFVVMAEGKRAAIRKAAVTLLEPLGEKLDQAMPESAQPDLRHNPDLDDVFGV